MPWLYYPVVMVTGDAVMTSDQEVDVLIRVDIHLN